MTTQVLFSQCFFAKKNPTLMPLSNKDPMKRPWCACSKQWMYHELMINREIWEKSTKISRQLFHLVSNFMWVFPWSLSGFCWWFWSMMLVHLVLNINCSNLLTEDLILRMIWTAVLTFESRIIWQSFNFCNTISLKELYQKFILFSFCLSYLVFIFFLINNLFLTFAPKIVWAFLKNRPKKLFSNWLVAGLLTSIV